MKNFSVISGMLLGVTLAIACCMGDNILLVVLASCLPTLAVSLLQYGFYKAHLGEYEKDFYLLSFTITLLFQPGLWLPLKYILSNVYGVNFAEPSQGTIRLFTSLMLGLLVTVVPVVTIIWRHKKKQDDQRIINELKEQRIDRILKEKEEALLNKYLK